MKVLDVRSMQALIKEYESMMVVTPTIEATIAALQMSLFQTNLIAVLEALCGYAIANNAQLRVLFQMNALNVPVWKVEVGRSISLLTGTAGDSRWIPMHKVESDSYPGGLYSLAEAVGVIRKEA